MSHFLDLVTLLQMRAEKQLQQPAYTFLLNGEQLETQWTYAELDRRARCIGALLQQYNAAGERVLLLYPPGMDFISAFFGCLYAGAIAVPAYPPRNKRHIARIQTIVDDAQARFVLTVKKSRKRIETWLNDHPSSQSIHFIPTDELITSLEDDWTPPNITGHNLAFLQYTSGSTALPKGVMVSHDNLWHNLKLIQEHFGHTPESLAVIWLPPYHDMGLIGGILQPLFAGFPAVLMSPTAFLQRPLRWLQAISDYQATTSGGPNFAYDLCVTKIPQEQRESLDLKSWRIAFNGAEPIQPETLRRFTAEFSPYGFHHEAWLPCYGLAENTLFVSGISVSDPPIIKAFDGDALTLNQVMEVERDAPNASRLVASGHAQDSDEVLIVDPETQKPCLPDRVGEIWVSGMSVAQGYWQKPEQTRETFQASLADSNGESFLRTGDLGFLRGKELFITGRCKDLIIIRGRNHYPQDIEQTVEHGYPALRWHSSAAFSVEIDGEEQLVIVAEVERRFRDRRLRNVKRAEDDRRQQPDNRKASEGRSEFDPQVPYRLDIDKALSTIREKVVEEHEINPYAILLLKYGTIPRTSSGKIQRHRCRAQFLSNTLESLAETRREHNDSLAEIPEPGSQRLVKQWDIFLAHLWGESLHLNWRSFYEQSNFFECGGDSFHAITLIGKLSDAIGVELETDLLYHYPNLQDLSVYLEKEYGAVPSMGMQDKLLAQYRKFCHPDRSLFPLLPLQQSFFITQALGDIAIYMFLNLELKGHLDTDLFQEALRILVWRHPALHSQYETTITGPGQQFLSPQTFTLLYAYYDLRHLNPQQREASIAKTAEELLQLRFSPECGKIFQAALLGIDEKTHRFIVNFNHLALDGFSVRIWFEELQSVYAGLRQGPSIESAPQTTLSFKEYVEIYTARQLTQQRERDRDYWLQNIPSYEPFPPLPDAGGDHKAVGFDAFIHKLRPGLVERLRKEAQIQNVTLFSLLMAAFFKLFALWTETSRLIINTPHLNRQPYAHDVQDVIGCFTDILPISLEKALEKPLCELVHDVHRLLADMHRHSSLSGVEIARLLAEKQHTTPQAISPIIFSSALFPLDKLESPETYQITSLEVRTGAPATWLDVILYEALGEFSCSWNFLQSKFSRAKIASLAAQYEAILLDFAERTEHADSLRVLQSFPDFAAWQSQQQDLMDRRLSEEERQRILGDWNDTEVEYPLDTCVHQIIETQVEQTPDEVALIFEGRTMHYRELNQRANQLAHYLRELGVGPESLVGICMERSFEMVIGLLGIIKAGGAYIPIDPEYPKERVAFMLNDAQPSVLLTQQHLVPQLPEHKSRIVCLDADWEHIASYPETNLDVDVTAESLMYMIYTSGSTGRPKGAMNIHRALVNRLLWMQDAYQLSLGDKVVQKTPFSFDVSGWEFWWPLMTGVPLVIVKPGGHKDSAYLARLIQDEQITTIHFVPSMLQVFLDEPGISQCTSLRRVICSGEALPLRLQERFFERLNAELHNLYGPTEAAIDVSYWPCQRASDLTIVPIGRPIANTQLYILSPDLEPVPVGAEGELHIGGVNLARGYLNRPELTQEKFIPNPFSDQPESRLYKTGDLCRYLPDGNIEYLGRLDHQVKIRGFRIELGEIEAVLADHEGVDDTVVLAREEEGDRRLIAYLIPSRSPAPQALELREFLKQKLPEYMLPSAYVVLESFPLNPNGKIDRKALPAPDRGGFQAQYAAPRTPTEELLSSLWKDLLQLEQVGIHDNFFEIGGHSLLAIQVISRIRQAFGIELEVRTVFDSPTIAGLAETVVAKQLEHVEHDALERMVAEAERLSEEEAGKRLLYNTYEK